MSCTWLEFGIIVDRDSAVKEVTYDYSTYRTTEYTYKIIGIRFLNVATSEFKDVYSKDLSGIELNQKEIQDISDIVDSLIGGRFRVRELYVNADDIELNYYINRRTSIYCHEIIQSALPVYDKNGNLLVCCNTDLCIYEFGFLEIRINVKTLSFDIALREPTDENRKYGVPFIRGLVSQSWNSALNIIKTEIEGVYLYDGLCYIYDYKEDFIILPDSCRTLYLSFGGSIKTIVFNKNIESIANYSLFNTFNTLTIYLSKDTSLEFMCSLFESLIYDYIQDKNEELVMHIKQLHTTVSILNQAKEYDRIWDTLNSSENKDIMQSVLSNFEIKVY